MRLTPTDNLIDGTDNNNIMRLICDVPLDGWSCIPWAMARFHSPDHSLITHQNTTTTIALIGAHHLLSIGEDEDDDEDDAEVVRKNKWCPRKRHVNGFLLGLLLLLKFR